ncbi:hypothetical protein LVJ94_32440 [Pendulispora rubella]|uniref:Lipoprotein n=1 Tax=Pendulispora rubella TaxID=2741070 RepID=A0ABZ2KZ62_9BACT
MSLKVYALGLVALVALGGCRESRRVHLVEHVEAAPSGTPYIPPQCYTKTQDETGRVHNPCFTCHADSAPPNYVADGSLQLAYEFAPPSRVNPWTNLFVDRTAAVAEISDEWITNYVRQDNYRTVARGTAVGWRPDIAFQFDDDGFDRAADGQPTGWRAYAYYPLPGSFWPTNGSFGDALIRLPAAFREHRDGRFDRGVYTVNLAILEALIARHDVPIAPSDEGALGQDLDGDGTLGEARVVRYRWKPGGGGMAWVGRAAVLQGEGSVHLAAGLFPEGTEFAHSLRYLDVENGRVRMAPRMKELRYMVKRRWMTYGEFEQQAAAEASEKTQSPHKTRAMVADGEGGIGSGAGWRLQGFIEDAGGALRTQTVEEHAFCIGCHSGIGVTDDSVISFGRKLPAASFQRGWFHPTQRGLEGLHEPTRADGRGEYTSYLEWNGAGDELRANDEVLTRFFDGNGQLEPAMAARASSDVSVLLLPSSARALRLDKAYRVIVHEQSFARGRDATVAPALHVHRALPEGDPPTGIAEARLDRRRTARAGK